MDLAARKEALGADGLLKKRIDGMDCVACAVKIENAVRRLPGTTNIHANYATVTLSLRLDKDRIPPEEVEATVRRLGFTCVLCNHAAVRASGRGVHSETSRWRRRKSGAAMASGALLIAAFLISTTSRQLGHLLCTAAALAGLLPVANRSMACIDSGTPFTIETLMMVSTVAAISIGASAEAAVVMFLFVVGELLVWPWRAL